MIEFLLSAPLTCVVLRPEPLITEICSSKRIATSTKDPGNLLPPRLFARTPVDTPDLVDAASELRHVPGGESEITTGLADISM